MNEVLLISTDKTETDAIAKLLQENGIQSKTVDSWDKALKLWETDAADLITVLRLPPNSPLLSPMLQEYVTVPIIFVDGSGDEQTHIQLLEQGVAQVIQRPFSLPILALQIRAYLHHTTPQLSAPSTAQTIGNLQLDKHRRTISNGLHAVRLSKLEFQLFELLWHHRQHVISAEQIVIALWRYSDAGDQLLVRKIIHRLRKKLNILPDISIHITNIPGAGYSLDIPH